MNDFFKHVAEMLNINHAPTKFCDFCGGVRCIGACAVDSEKEGEGEKEKGRNQERKQDSKDERNAPVR